MRHVRMTRPMCSILQGSGLYYQQLTVPGVWDMCEGSCKFKSILSFCLAEGQVMPRPCAQLRCACLPALHIALAGLWPPSHCIDSAAFIPVELLSIDRTFHSSMLGLLVGR